MAEKEREFRFVVQGDQFPKETQKLLEQLLYLAQNVGTNYAEKRAARCLCSSEFSPQEQQAIKDFLEVLKTKDGNKIHLLVYGKCDD